MLLNYELVWPMFDSPTAPDWSAVVLLRVHSETAVIDFCHSQGIQLHPLFHVSAASFSSPVARFITFSHGISSIWIIAMLCMKRYINEKTKCFFFIQCEGEDECRHWFNKMQYKYAANFDNCYVLLSNSLEYCIFRVAYECSIEFWQAGRRTAGNVHSMQISWLSSHGFIWTDTVSDLFLMKMSTESETRIIDRYKWLRLIQFPQHANYSFQHTINFHEILAF